MSAANATAVRQPLAARRGTRRHLDERLLMRFPALLSFVARRLSSLPPSSRLRQVTVSRALRLGFEAFNRSDYRAAFALYHPDVESEFPPDLVSVGFPARTHGREERVEVQRRWDAEWGEFRNEPEELIDLGDRVLVLGRLTGRGLSSGVGFETEVAYLFDVPEGRAIREQMFTDQGAALVAAGLEAGRRSEP